MNPADRPRFAALMSRVSDVYNKPITEAGLSLWWGLLEARDFTDIETAFRLHMLDPERGRFIPMPADIVRLLDGTGGSRAQLAWSAVRDAIRSVGPYRSVVFDEPITHAVIEDMGGWIRLCEMETEEAPFRGKEFVDRFQAYAVRGGAPRHAGVLSGEHDMANRLRFSEYVRAPVLIGDPQRALAVMQAGDKGAVKVTELDALPIAKSIALAVKCAGLGE